MLKKIFQIGIIFFCVIKGSAQNNKGLQYGIALKTTIDINGIESKGKYSNFNIALFGGIGGHLWDATGVYPSLHIGGILYNRGDLISSYKKTFFKSTRIDFMIDATITFGVKSSSGNFNNRNIPLVHFSDFTSNPLQNPYQNSLGIGSNLIWTGETVGKKKDFQRVGTTSLMIDRRVQISTYNDGSIWGQLKLGDKEDRYYTGGAWLSYHMKTTNKGFDVVELSIHKFTGFEENTFEAGTSLQLDFIPYKNEETKYYNKQRIRITARNTNRDYGIHLTFHNTDKDFQDAIHFGQNTPYHPDIFSYQKGFLNELRRMGIGAFWRSNENKFIK